MFKPLFSLMLLPFWLLLVAGCVSSPPGDRAITDLSYGAVQLGTPVSELIQQGEYESDKHAYGEGHNCYYLHRADEPEGVYYMIVDQRVVRFDVGKASDVLTDQAVGVGSSKLEILAAYSDVSISEHPYLGSAGEYLTVSLENGNGLIFETYKDVVTSYRLGLDPHVFYIEGCL